MEHEQTMTADIGAESDGFELHRSALEGAKAMDQYHENLASAAAPSMALVPVDDGEYEVAEA